MLKLLIITNRFVIGGPAFHVADLAFQLQNDFDIMIVGGEAGKGEETNREMFAYLKSEPIVIDGFSRNASLSKDWKSYKKIKQLIKEFQPDIVHTHTSKPGFLGRMAAHALGVKVIVHTYHGNLFEGYFNSLITSIIIKLEKFLAKRTSALIALSPQQQRVLVSKGVSDENKIKIIYPGIDKSRLHIKKKFRTKFRNKYSLREDDIVIAIMGRLVEIKNIQLFIDGIKYLNDKGIQKVRGLIVGDGPEKRNLKEYTWSLKLGCVEFGSKTTTDSLIFTSWCRDISQLYSAIDLLALTSKNEGTPYSLIEAQICGIPIVAADVGGVSDIVQKGKSALLFGSREEFYSSLEKVVSDAQLRETMSEEGKKYALNRFESLAMAEETKKLYLDLINDMN